MKEVVELRFTMVLLPIFTLLLLTSCGNSTQSSPKESSPQETSRLKMQSTVKAPALIQPKSSTNRIVMGWNAFGNTETYIKQDSVSPKLTVVSPLWFRLDAKQYVTSSVDPIYVTWAHDSGKQIWPLLGNRFDPVLTDSIISDKIKSKQLITLLCDILVKNNIDGINVDFENMDIKNKNDYVNFIRQLKDTLHPHGILVSVDVTRENPDPNWSGCYDRHGLGMAADFIVMMGYDEDLAGGGKVGSVSSLPWVEQGLKLLLRDVPARKVILASPFYTRDWATNLDTGNIDKTELAAADVEKMIAEKGLVKQWDPQTRQHYVEFTENREKHQIWIEDQSSLKQRLNLVNHYKIRGIAFWLFGQEPPEIWQAFNF
jgi:spore germination protein YaaH